LDRIFNYIADGGVLIFHDWNVSNAATILPGAAGTFVYDPENNLTLISDNETFINGPGGEINNSTLDVGNSSSHGFVYAQTAPEDAVGLLSQADPNRWVTYGYPYGRGYVIYST